MRRYWVINSSTGKEAIGTYFDSRGQAKAVAEALERETGDGYNVSQSPG